MTYKDGKCLCLECGHRTDGIMGKGHAIKCPLRRSNLLRKDIQNVKEDSRGE